MQTTLQARIKDQSVYPILDQVAAHLSRARRSVFGELSSKSRRVSEIKKDAIVGHGITARQFNSIRYELQGLIESDQEIKKLRIEKIKRRIKKKKEQLKGTFNPFKRHHLKRKIGSLEMQLKNREEELISPSICFGGRKLFSQQYHLEENGFADHAAWKKEWEKARDSHFFLIGSKDEKFGNQSCQLLPQGLQLRLTNTLAAAHGKTTITIPVQFTYREDVITNALLAGQAMNYRFVKKDDCWYVHLTTEISEVERITNRGYGALGIDLNPACIAVTQIGSDGNFIKSWQVSLNLRGRRSDQIEATLGEEIAKLVEYSQHHKIPIVIEKLDFEKKKEELRSRHLNRMLSNFAYRTFSELMNSQCYRAGVELIEVNPAYTSIIGEKKFSEGYGLSTHMAAAMAIARRGLGFGEGLRTKAQVRSSLPVRNRVRHVWSDWRRSSQKAKKRRKSSLRRQRPERTRGDRRSSNATACNGPPLQGLH